MAKLTGSLLALAVSLGTLAPVGQARQDSTGPAAGLWHLVAKDTDEQNIPEHRMDLRLYPSPAPFRAVIVNRVTLEDIPYAVATFDGRTLRLQMRAHAEQAQASIAWLEMKWNGTRFDGGYVDGDGKAVPRAVALKLIRAKSPCP